MFFFQAPERNDARNELSSASVGWNDPVSSDKDKSVQRAMWIFKSTQREHEIKLRMLHIELERAELQKQTAINELKTSEIKKQLMEDQAAEYYRLIHSVQHFYRYIVDYNLMNPRGKNARHLKSRESVIFVAPASPGATEFHVLRISVSFMTRDRSKTFLSVCQVLA